MFIKRYYATHTTMFVLEPCLTLWFLGRNNFAASYKKDRKQGVLFKTWHDILNKRNIFDTKINIYEKGFFTLSLLSYSVCN